jgi:acyl phosphate:glycerol-3-phosphate acyltransferase
LPASVYVAVILSYLLGAVPFGFIVARLRGVDIFSAGSGNIGATNVGRVLGRKYGSVVFVLDLLKGAVPVALVRHYLPEVPWAVVAVGLAAFVGHMFPIYLRFRGGKGVATGAGVVAMLLPGPTAVAALVWVSVLAATRYVSLASMLAALTLPVVWLLSIRKPFDADKGILTGFALLAAILVTFRHRANLARLNRGDESRVPDSARLRMLSRVLHILAMSLWFGGGFFFTFAVALSLFHTFEGLEGQQPDWLPLRTGLTKVQGTRLAGLAVAPLFPAYFAVQGACGLVALITAWAWTRTYPDRIHRIRVIVIALALILVLAGWPLVEKIQTLRFERYSPDEAVAAAANKAFGLYHGISLALNLAVLALAGVATALAARLPGDPSAAALPKAG